MTILQPEITKYNFQYFAEQLGYKVIPEFKFSKKRKFRNDWKITKDEKSCGIEYEGVRTFYGNQHNGHTDLVSYTKDCEKYNLAILENWPIFRYTCKNFNKVWEDLEEFFKI